MTLPISGALTLDAVMTELRLVDPSRAYPINLGDADVRALAAVPSGAITLSALYGKSSYIPMTVTGFDDYGFAQSAFGGGTVSCSPLVTVANGRDPKTYLWSFTSNPDGCALTNATSATCTVQQSYSGDTTGSASAVLQCQVTDSFPNTVTVSNVNALLEWANFA